MLSHKDFASKTKYNIDTQNQIWMSNIADSHDCWCDCPTPFAHLLSSIFPPGHRDRHLTIEQILQRDYKEKCLSGGGEEESHGMAGSGADGELQDIKDEGEEFQGEEIENLLAAADAENTR